MKIRKKDSINVSKNVKKKCVDLLLIGTMFLLKILMHSCMIIHYFAAENIVIALSFQ